METSLSYGRRIWIAFDQLLNALAGGWPDETLSARCHRMRLAGTAWPARVLNAIVFWQKDHCLSAFTNEQKRAQSPEEYR